MKIKFLIVAGMFAFIVNIASAQVKSYATTGGELVFSFANIDNKGMNPENIIRFSPVFNLQVYGNFDFGKHFGIIAGGSIRNIGFINGNTDPENTGIKQKYRTYNLGIPIGFKIGDVNKFFFFGGYEIEFPFHYKEKTFINGVKQDSKISTWFSNRVPTFYNSVFAGVQFPYGFNLKFKYYFTNFFNESFTETIAGVQTQPYNNYKANVFYFSLSFSLFQNNHVYYKEYKKTNEIY
jgi:hypothetical protein